MTGELRIDQLYVFIVVDDDGTEGVPAVSVGGIVLPLLGADKARVDSLRAMIRLDPTLQGKTITLARFSHRENLEVLEP